MIFALQLMLQILEVTTTTLVPKGLVAEDHTNGCSCTTSVVSRFSHHYVFPNMPQTLKTLTASVYNTIIGMGVVHSVIIA